MDVLKTLTSDANITLCLVSTKIHRSIHLINITGALAYANHANEWNTLVYRLTEIEGMYQTKSKLLQCK